MLCHKTNRNSFMFFVFTLRASVHCFRLTARVDISKPSFCSDMPKPPNLSPDEKTSPRVPNSAVIPIIGNVTAGEYPD